MHGFFSHKYSKNHSANITIQQEEGAGETLVEDEMEDIDETVEASNDASNQTGVLVEREIIEDIQNPANSQGERKMSEPAPTVRKATENIEINTTVADLELAENMTESRSEDDPATQQEVDRLVELEQNSPTEIDAVESRFEMEPKYQSVYESSGMVRCSCFIGLYIRADLANFLFSGVQLMPF